MSKIARLEERVANTRNELVELGQFIIMSEDSYRCATPTSMMTPEDLAEELEGMYADLVRVAAAHVSAVLELESARVERSMK